MIVGFAFVQTTVFSCADLAIWATPLNTILLIALAIVSRKMHFNVKEVAESVDHAAMASAAAAAAAADTARISKEIGGQLRLTRPLEPNGDPPDA